MQAADLPFFYNFAAITVLENRPVEVDPACNGVTFINTGTVQAVVNGVPLNAGVPGTSLGESFTVGGNRGEFFKGRIDVNFPANGSGSLLVVQKFYVDL